MPTDRVVGSPPDALGSGDVVRITGHPAPGNPPNGSEREAEAN
jgi:hypothetical protein